MRNLLLAITFLCLFLNSLVSQTTGEGYKFTIKKQIPATSVKDQNRTNTCWSFSAVSMLESELIRMGKGEYDLSEMFIVYHTYLQKAEKYVRMHGHIEFAGGGENNDVTDVIKTFGIVPEDAFSGLKWGETGHNHIEMDKVLKVYVDEIVKSDQQTLSPVWLRGFESILKSYLGDLPKKFKYNGQQYTPESFSASLAINPDDYVMLSSFTHHPFYSSFIPEVPDNWSWGKAYNVPLDDLVSIVDNAVENGYTVSWASDVSDKGFNFKKGVAIVPDFEKEASSQDWENSFSAPAKEKVITQELRQREFDNYSTTDDHGMHITGTGVDQTGKKYYYTKNSWGTENPYKGYLFVSESFFRLKTTVIFLNKNGIPEVIRKKLGI
jgi:bleomycin hydrolase